MKSLPSSPTSSPHALRRNGAPSRPSSWSSGVLGRGRSGTRSRRRPRRQPWVFGGQTRDLPYVFAPPPEPPPVTNLAPATDAQPDAPADAVEPDGAPDDAAGEVGARRAPKRPALPRDIPGATAAIAWSELEIGAFPISPAPRGGGIYIVRGANGPLYVGETSSFAVRWSKRLREAYQGGLIERALGDRRVRLWLGTIPATVSQTARETLESAIYRTLVHGGLGERLRNDSSFNAFKNLAPIAITNVLPPDLRRQLKVQDGAPPAARQAIQKVLDDNALVLAARTVFEVGFYEPSQRAPFGSQTPSRLPAPR
jgi:hypothetical protein